MDNKTTEIFPLSKIRSVRGSRRLAREKVLQILIAEEICGTDPEVLFHHIFFRDFNLGEDEIKHDRFLRPEDVVEIEADVPIKWKNDEIEFGKSLLDKTIKNQKYIDDLLKIFADNWELDRIANIDRKLMHLAITELMEFDQIPPKVSINESIEIAKYYSTDKSSVFINGVLDSVLDKLKEDGRISKSGRGLKDY